MRKLMVFVMFAMLAATVFAQTVPTSRIYDAAEALYCGLRDVLPVIAMLMIIVAGVIYAAGQMMGAETRARANVWATAALTGALIAILIVVIAPSVFSIIYGTGWEVPPCSGITSRN